MQQQSSMPDDVIASIDVNRDCKVRCRGGSGVGPAFDAFEIIPPRPFLTS